jgi:hypothetical protein
VRAAEGEPAKVTLAGLRGKIEVLGKGQMFVAFGGHESGPELRWTDAPGDVRLDELRAASEDDVRTLLDRCAPILGATLAQQANGEDHDPGEPQADTLRIAAALASIPNHGPSDWEAWNRVGMAVWRAAGGSSAGWEAFNAWSSRNPAYDPREARARWDHYRTSPPTQIGAGTIFHLAKQYGWRDPQPEDDPAYAASVEAQAEAETAQACNKASAGQTAHDGLDDPGYVENLQADAESGRAIVKVIKGGFVAAAQKIEAIAARARLPIYSHGEALCRPFTEQRKRYDGQIVTIAALRNYNTASLRRALDPAIEFMKFDGRRKSFTPCEPPAGIINMVLSGEQRQILPPIRGIIGTPILRPDRTIITTEGYDADTGYYVVDPPGMPPIPARPTRADAEKALAVLQDLISEFPFADYVSESVALSGLITPLVRAACDVVPGHLFTAPKQGSGKSLLVDVASAIATGERAYAILAHRQPEEQDKQLTAALLEARQIIALDNLTSEIESAVLAQATERELISLRPLGTSQTVRIVNSFNCYLTGNNVTIAGDNTRRILVGRVDPQVENPLDRTFAKPNPVIRVFKDRGTFVAACLTIVLAYVAHGRPNKLTPIPSYEAWSDLVREPLVWLGLADPTETMRTAFDDDPANAALATLMAAWPKGQPDWTCAEIIDAATKTDQYGDLIDPRLADALKPIARDRRGAFDATVFGGYLRQNRDKIVGDRKISRHPMKTHEGVNRWMLV